MTTAHTMATGQITKSKDKEYSPMSMETYTADNGLTT